MPMAHQGVVLECRALATHSEQALMEHVAELPHPALILVLDQFSRNLFRNHPAAFAADPMALALSQEALQADDIGQLNAEEKSFLIMPYMHSESKVIHEQALRLFSEPGLENNLEFERQHKAIIDQFGRYPHRNELLGRKSTPEELEYLGSGGQTF